MNQARKRAASILQELRPREGGNVSQSGSWFAFSEYYNKYQLLSTGSSNMSPVKCSRRRITLLLFGVLLVCCSGGFALDPSLDVNQYSHKAWTVREGFSKSEISAITQTPDGYIWLGTGSGLLRFDGVRTVPWQPPPGAHLPSAYIISLLTASDGTLWIGTANGLASWKNGKLTRYSELAEHYIFALLEDHQGTVWVSGISALPGEGRLCAIHSGTVQCYGEDGSLGRGAFSLYEDSKGGLWAGVKNGLWRWGPGPSKFYPLPGEPDGIQALGEDSDGTLLVGWKGALYRFVDGKTELYPLPNTARRFAARRIVRDRDGSLWIGTVNHGIMHMHRGKTDVFAQSDGLSGDDVLCLFEDREGNIWATTINGLDRFREFAILTVTQKQGLSNTVVASVAADNDGAIWLSTLGGLNRLRHGQVETYRIGSDKQGGINDLPNSLFQGNDGRVWVSTSRQVGYMDNDRFVALPGMPGGAVLSMAQDVAGNLWVANEQRGLFRLSPQNQIRQFSWAQLGHKDHASVIIADPSRGGIWIGFFLGGVAYFADGQIRASYTTADGLGEGRISSFQFARDGALWIATEGGLSHLKNDHIATLTSRNGLPCDTVNWVMEDNHHSFWLSMPCDLVRIPQEEMDAWTAAVAQDKNTKRTVQGAVFDSSDGVRTLASSGHFSPQVAKSTDGKIWFVPWDGVSIIDANHLPFNKVPPPVHIEQVSADGKSYDPANGLQLPPHVRDLVIDYTALSLVAPEKVHFRYWLEGQDPDWREVVNDRQVQYSNLAPRHYTFRVLASNNSGVWNEAGASLEFSVLPAYYQTTWFRMLCGAAFVFLLWGVYQLRVRQLRYQFAIGLEARVNERTRIARELHDTLLQSLQGLMLHFQTGIDLLPGRPVEAQKTLEIAVDQADRAINEGRDAVQGLRASAVETNDLVSAVRILGEELGAADTNQKSVAFEVDVEGVPRNLHPILRDEVYRIAAEALRNAFQHADAQRIEVEILYGERWLRLRVRDDGKGIDPKFLSADGRAKHYGLHGMRERAQVVGGRLVVWSKVDSGTEVELSIPATAAYATIHRRHSWLSGKFSRRAANEKETDV